MINTLFTHCWLAETCISRKTNFNGYDISSHSNIRSADACMSSCYDNPQCVSFTYALGWTTCYIKYAQPLPIPDVIFDSGPKLCPGRLFGKNATVHYISPSVNLYKSASHIHLSVLHYGLLSLHAYMFVITYATYCVLYSLFLSSTKRLFF